MRLIKSISRAGGKINEDYILHNDYNYVLLLDGASGLQNNLIHNSDTEDASTDAQWFVEEFARLIMCYVDSITPAKDLVKKCISELKQEYNNLLKGKEHNLSVFEPSASMAFIKRTGGIIELLILGDITVIIKGRNNEVSVFFDDSVQALDNKALTVAKIVAAEQQLNVCDAMSHGSVRTILEQNRSRKNSGSEGGYWVLGLQEDAVDHAIYQQLNEAQIEEILICTDGFASYIDRYHLAADMTSFFAAAHKYPLERLYKRIRSVEEKDPFCNAFPRFKVSDDATAALIVCEAEKKESGRERFWTNLNVRLHRIMGKFQSAYMTFGVKKGYIITLLMTLGSIIYTVLTILNQKSSQSTDALSIYPYLVTVITAVYTLFTTIYDYVDYSNSYLIFSDPSRKRDTLEKLELSPRQKALQYDIFDFFNGQSIEKYIMSPTINEYLQQQPLIETAMLKSKFRIVDEVAKLVPSIMGATFRKPGITFNGKLLRQAGEISPGAPNVLLQKTAYFDGQCTHEIVYKQFKSSHEIELAFDGRKLLMDKDNVCYDMDVSSCSNFIGISTLVFTKDRRFIVGQQAAFSRANRGRFAPSGSGSVNNKDTKYAKSFGGILTYAMEREFCEECNYSIKKARTTMRTRLIGYVRLLERGGKPDYFGLSYIDENACNLQNKIRKLEHGLSNHFDTCYFASYDQLPVVMRRFCSKYEQAKDRRISIQLEIICGILEQMAKSNMLVEFMEDLSSSGA